MSTDELPPEGDGWPEWRKHVLLTLESFTEGMRDLTAQVVSCRIQIAKLKVKSGLWGAMGASVPILIGFILWLLAR